jgi:hypothetical protein
MKLLSIAMAGALMSVVVHADGECHIDRKYPSTCSYASASFGDAMHKLGFDMVKWAFQNDTAAVSAANPNNMTIGVKLADGTVQYTDFPASNTNTTITTSGMAEGFGTEDEVVETMVNNVYVRFFKNMDFSTPSGSTHLITHTTFRVCIAPAKDQVGVCQDQ